jgi:hypothetical protein
MTTEQELKYCFECKHYPMPSTKEPCKSCLPNAKDLPKHEKNEQT